MADFAPTSFSATREEPGFVGWSDNGPIFRAPAADFAMMGEGPPYWPRADHTIQRAQTDGGSMLGGPPKALWHTTETSTWPGYSTGSFPHLTVMVGPGELFLARQHIPFNRAARALRNESGGVQTNRLVRCQVEIVTRADVVDTHGLHPAMEDGLAELAEWLEANWGVPRICTVEFLTYPESYGDSPVRLSPAAWERYTGWCGHMSVPENEHGDPGALDWRPILQPGAQPTTQEDLAMADAQDILNAIELLRVGDTAGGPADTHDYASLEGVGRQVRALDGLLRIAIWGSVRGAEDTHDETLSIEGVNRRLGELEDLVREVLAAVAPPEPAPPTTPIS